MPLRWTWPYSACLRRLLTHTLWRGRLVGNVIARCELPASWLDRVEETPS